MDNKDFLPPERPPRKPRQEPSARLTLDAYVRLRRELEELRTEGRTEIAERLLRAREHGDIRENADYDAAKNEQGLMEARVRDLEHMLKDRSEEHTSELQSLAYLVCRLLLEKKNTTPPP